MDIDLPTSTQRIPDRSGLRPGMEPANCRQTRLVHWCDLMRAARSFRRECIRYGASPPSSLVRAYLMARRDHALLDVIRTKGGALKLVASGYLVARIDAGGRFYPFKGFSLLRPAQAINELLLRAEQGLVMRVRQNLRDAAQAMPEKKRLALGSLVTRYANMLVRKTIKKNWVATLIDEFTLPRLDELLSFCKTHEVVDTRLMAYASREGTEGQWCRQVIEAYPLLAELVSEGKVFEGVAKGESFLKLASAQLRVPVSMLRRYRNITHLPFTRCKEELTELRLSKTAVWVKNVASMVRATVWFPPHLQPRTKSEHMEMGGIFHLFPNRRSKEDVQALFRGVKRLIDPERPLHRLVDLRDVEHSLYREVGSSIKVRRIIKHYNLTELHSLNSRWHQASRAATIAVQAGEDQVSRNPNAINWQPLIRQAKPLELETGYGGKVQLVELLNIRQLAEEGESLNHCVGSYAERCYTGNSRILSFRSIPGYKRMSTVEIVIRSDRPVPIQHRGHTNQEAPPQAEIALQAFLRQMEKNPSDFNFLWPRAVITKRDAHMQREYRNWMSRFWKEELEKKGVRAQ